MSKVIPTKTFIPGFSGEIGNVVEYSEDRYCVYCLKKAEEIKRMESVNHRADYTFMYYCTCSLAEEEADLLINLQKKLEEASKLEDKIDKIRKSKNDDGINQSHYEADLKKLNKRYGVE